MVRRQGSAADLQQTAEVSKSIMCTQSVICATACATACASNKPKLLFVMMCRDKTVLQATLKLLQVVLPHSSLCKGTEAD